MIFEILPGVNPGVFLCIFGQNSEYESQTANRENENIPQV
jgi:hypothetical protein